MKKTNKTIYGDRGNLLNFHIGVLLFQNRVMLDILLKRRIFIGQVYQFARHALASQL